MIKKVRAKKPYKMSKDGLGKILILFKKKIKKNKKAMCVIKRRTIFLFLGLAEKINQNVAMHKDLN